LRNVFLPGKTFLNTIEYLDPLNEEWTTFIPMDTMDFPEEGGNAEPPLNGDPQSVQVEAVNDVTITETPEDIKTNDVINENGVVDEPHSTELEAVPEVAEDGKSEDIPE
jgi:hypothetical protein